MWVERELCVNEKGGKNSQRTSLKKTLLVYELEDKRERRLGLQGTEQLVTLCF